MVQGKRVVESKWFDGGEGLADWFALIHLQVDVGLLLIPLGYH